MPITKYSYKISTDFPNGKIASDQLTFEIQNSSIVIALERIDTNLSNDICDIWFKDTLLVQDKFLLDGNSIPPSSDSIIGKHDGVGLLDITNPFDNKTSDNILRVSIEPTEGRNKTIVSHNFCDPTTWYQESIVNSGVMLSPDVTFTTYSGSGIWIDNFHGKYSDEDFLLTNQGLLPRLKVYKDGELSIENNPDTGQGDYFVDYIDSGITFNDPLNILNNIEADIFYENGSMWTLRPLPNKKFKIISVKLQMSHDVKIVDDMIFELYGYVDVFAPSLTPIPYPSGTKIRIENPVIYKSKSDIVNKSTTSSPIIPKHNIIAGFRDLDVEIQTYTFLNAAVVRLSSNHGMELRVKLKNDIPFQGKIATLTFNCLEYNEQNL